MPVQLKLDTIRKLLVAHASGQITTDDIIGATGDEIARTKGASLHSDCLIILDKTADYHQMDFDAMMRLKDKVEHWVACYPGRNIRTAFVVPHSRQLAVCTLWRAMAQLFPGIGEQPRIFETESTALDWLRPGNELRH